MKAISRIFIGIFLIYLIAIPSQAALIQNDTPSPASDIKLDHRFGAGLMVAGQAGLMGVSIDLNFNPFFSTTAIIGTGYDFSSLGFKAQYYILGTSVHPYIGAGYAYWWASPGITNIKNSYPGLIDSSLLSEEQIINAFANGFNLHLIYPTFGVQFIHDSQFSLAGEIMYLFDITDFSGSPYFGISSHYYF
jgi:hypothetical protein